MQVQEIQESTKRVADALVRAVKAVSTSEGEWDDVAVQVWVTGEGVRIKVTGVRDGVVVEVGDRDVAVSLFDVLQDLFVAYQNAGDPWEYACVTVGGDGGFTCHVEYSDPD